MKVNISGRGSIPGVGVLAPAYGIEMDKVSVRRLLNFQTFRVFQASSGLIITTANIESMFANENKVAVNVKPVSTPVVEKKPEPIKKVEKVEEVKANEEPVKVVEESVNDTVEETHVEESVDDTVEEKKDTESTNNNQQSYNPNRRKNRHHR